MRNETDFASYADNNTSYAVGNNVEFIGKNIELLSVYKMHHLHFSNDVMIIK